MIRLATWELARSIARDYRVAALVKKALVVAAIDPLNMSENAREARLDSLSEVDRRRLFELDLEFYDAVQDCMERLHSFVNA